MENAHFDRISRSNKAEDLRQVADMVNGIPEIYEHAIQQAKAQSLRGATELNIQLEKRVVSSKLGDVALKYRSLTARLKQNGFDATLVKLPEETALHKDVYLRVIW